jgi:polysaccharide biosynthesis protein PslG
MNSVGRHQIRMIVAAMAALVVLPFFAPAPARAVEPGVVTDLSWYVPDSDKDRSIAATREIGSKWSRIHVQWREAEPVKGVLNEWWIAEYEEAIDRSVAAGQRVVVMIYNAPAWASGSASRNTPRDPADFAGFAAKLAERFRGKVAGYEVWNEQNIERFWSGGPDAAEYTRLLRAAYPAIKAADPAAKVVFGGLSTNDYDYLEKAYAAGAKGYFDVLGTHPYTYCGSSGPESVRRRPDGRLTPDSFIAYRELRASMAARGDAKPIWATEFGWNTSGRECDPGAGFWQGGVSEAKQAEYLTKALEIFSRDPYMEVAMWYSLRDPYWLTDSPNDPESSTGLLTVDYGHKAAFGAFRSWANGGSSPPATDAGTGTGTGTGTGGDPGAGQPTTTTIKVKGKGKKKPKPRVVGRVAGATGGEVEVTVEKRRGGGWAEARTVSARVGADGRYAARLRRIPAGRLRVRAQFAGTEAALPSVSNLLCLRL